MLPLSNHFFVFGGQVQQAKLQDDSVTRVVTKTLSSGHKASRAVFESSKNSVKQSALFLEDRIDIGKDILLTLGSRLDHHEKYGSHWSPRVYAVYHINDNFSLKGGVSKAFKAPSIREISESYVTSTEAGAGVIYGNKNLKPETSVNEEIALVYTNNNGYNASITLFNTDFKNKLTSHYTGLTDPVMKAKLYEYTLNANLMKIFLHPK